MKKDGINKDNIFGLFEGDYDTLKNAKDLSGKIDNFNSSPTIKIGMFTKLILNHNIFHQKLEKFLTKEEPNYSIESTKESSEFIVYNRAWFYLNQVDMSQKEDVFAILDFNPKILNNALESALLYFQNREEYEKCAHIFKIQQVLRESKR
jgi:hypothetical protein|tara:strand:+ start:228 stop:677 length:450 start_codon:yes stop_codon:yes gene_type:complete